MLREVLPELGPNSFLDNSQLEKLARELLKRTDQVRIFQSDVQIVVKLLREVFNQGRARGMYEV